jgi:ribosomal protein L37AE/L43A
VIENFSREDFEAALPAGLWKDSGMDARSRQRVYTVTPFPTIPFGVLVFSSLQHDGSSSHRTGKDSIRCVIVDAAGKPYGGKPVRWIDRRPGWQERLLEYLRHLANQILWLARPCTGCNGPLLPFTAKSGKTENKGRGFVCCKNEGCSNPFWQWTEDPEGNRIPPSSHRPVPDAVPDAAPDAPTCPLCKHLMVRMRSGKGWRCATPGNTWRDNCWTVCAGAIFDA